MKIAIIPARGGSKRILRKNVKSFCGKPIIAWSIEAAQKSNLFDHIIISTDDDEIAEIALKFGADVPFRRPSHLADDFIGTSVVIKHATEWVINNIGTPELVCTIYATAPFIQASDLSAGLDLLLTKNKSIAFTVTSYGFPIQRAIKINKDNVIEMFQPEHFNTRSQDLDTAYHDAGQFYWARTEAILNEVNGFSEYGVPIILPRYQVQDIDTHEDWRRAELMFEAWNKR